MGRVQGRYDMGHLYNDVGRAVWQGVAPTYVLRRLYHGVDAKRIGG